MALSLQGLRDKLAEFEIEYMGDRAALTYRPATITEQMIGRFRAVERAQRARQAAFDAGEDVPEAEEEERTQLDVLNEVLCATCFAWDVMGDDGRPVPFTPEALRELPIPFKMAVFQQIMEDYQGNQTRSAVRSGGGSRRTGR